MTSAHKIKCKTLEKKLWCGSMINFHHNFLTHEINFFVEVEDTGVTKKYFLNLKTVSDFIFHINHPEEDWDYVEITEIEVFEENNLFIIKCQIWGSASMKIVCKDFELQEILE